MAKNIVALLSSFAIYLFLLHHAIGGNWLMEGSKAGAFAYASGTLRNVFWVRVLGLLYACCYARAFRPSAVTFACGYLFSSMLFLDELAWCCHITLIFMVRSMPS